MTNLLHFQILPNVQDRNLNGGNINVGAALFCGKGDSFKLSRSVLQLSTPI